MRPSPLASSRRRHAMFPVSIVLFAFTMSGSAVFGESRWWGDPSETATVQLQSERVTGWAANGKSQNTKSQGRKATTTTTSTTASTTSTTSSTTTTTMAVVTLPSDSTTSSSTTAAPTTTESSTTTEAPAPPAQPVTGAQLLGVDERKYGYAEWRGVTGGVGGESYVVTSAADSGAGTYRDALSKGNRYITFAPELDGAVIQLNGAVTTSASNITIDASGREITVSRFATKFSGSNIVIAGMNYRGMTGSTNEDAITFRDASTVQVFALYGNTFETATDGLVDVIWNRGNDVYGTVCGNQFLRHDKAMLVHSGDQANEGGRYHVTVCENHWVDVYQRAPFSRDARVHQYNDVLERYGDPTGAGGGSKSGGESELSQHLLQNNIAMPRRLGESTWTGVTVTKPRTEFAGPQWGTSGAIRIDGSLLLSSGDTTASQLENLRSDVTAPPYGAPLMPADQATRGAVQRNAGTCAPNPVRSINPCAPIVTAAGGVVAIQVAGDAAKVVVRVDGADAVEANHAGGGRWEAALPAGQVGWVDAIVTDHSGATVQTNRAVVTAR